MKNKEVCIILGLGLILVFTFFMPIKFELIPLVHNIFLIGGFFLLAALCLFLGYIFGKIKVTKKATKIIKIILLCLYYGLIGLGLYFYIILGVFSYKTGEKVSYKDQTYYIMDESFFDPYYVVYKKTGPVTMESFGPRYNFIPELTEENIEKIILGSYEYKEEKSTSHEETVDKTQEEISQEVEENIQDPQTKEEREALFNSLYPEELIKIPDSPYVLGMVDKALGSSYFYYFGKEENGKISYISELIGYPAYKSGEIKEDKIELKFIDANRKTYTYQSTDGGKHFEQIDPEEDQWET